MYPLCALSHAKQPIRAFSSLICLYFSGHFVHRRPLSPSQRQAHHGYSWEDVDVGSLEKRNGGR
jgi:hypothetical protein